MGLLLGVFAAGGSGANPTIHTIRNTPEGPGQRRVLVLVLVVVQVLLVVAVQVQRGVPRGVRWGLPLQGVGLVQGRQVRGVLLRLLVWVQQVRGVVLQLQQQQVGHRWWGYRCRLLHWRPSVRDGMRGQDDDDGHVLGSTQGRSYNQNPP